MSLRGTKRKKDCKAAYSFHCPLFCHSILYIFTSLHLSCISIKLKCVLIVRIILLKQQRKNERQKKERKKQRKKEKIDLWLHLFAKWY